MRSVQSLVVTVHIDGGDLGCAQLLVLLRDRARDLPAGTVVHLTTSDPVAPVDLPAWCRMTGHRYLGPVPDEPARTGRVAPGATTYAVVVAAHPRATAPDRPWHLAEGS